MNDLINREAAIASAISGRIRYEDGERWIRVSEVRENIMEVPPVVDVVDKKIYDRLNEDVKILSDLIKLYQHVEPLTDNEQRIFLAAMSKEKKLCENIEELWKKLNLTSLEDIDLIKVCEEIERKVKKALWTN